MNKIACSLAIALCAALLCACGMLPAEEPSTPPAFEDAFVWQPADRAPYGADKANRSAYGMADARDGVIYYQYYPYNTLCALDAQGQIQTLAENCYGMINASDDAVYYIGDTENGIFRYDYETGAVTKLWDGLAENMVTTKDYVFFMEGNTLCRMEKDGLNCISVMENLRSGYLDVVGDTVCVSRRIVDDPNCSDAHSLFAIDAHAPEKVSVVKEAMPAPVQHLGNKILCRNLDGIYLLEEEGDGRMVVLEEEGVNMVRTTANGNAVFCVWVLGDYDIQLRIYDIGAGTLSEPFPLHNAELYLMEGGVYAAHTGDNFQLEQIVLAPGNFHTEWLIGEGLRKTA